MTKKYKLKELEIKLKNGAVLHVEIDDFDGMKSIFEDLSKANFEMNKSEESESYAGQDSNNVNKANNDPYKRLENKAALENGKLIGSNLIGFKENVPQLLRPNIFSNTTDAFLVLLFAVETGLNTSKISYDSFKGLFDAQNIKSGTPMRILLSNLRTSGYLDKNKYSADRSLSLTAKGERKAIEVLKETCK